MAWCLFLIIATKLQRNSRQLLNLDRQVAGCDVLGTEAEVARRVRKDDIKSASIA